MTKIFGWLHPLRKIAAPSASKLKEIESQAVRLWDPDHFERAFQFCSSAVKDWPHSAQLHYILGACHFKARNYAEAATCFGLAQEATTEYPLVLYADLFGALASCRTAAGKRVRLAEPNPAARPFVSIIICSVDDHKFQAVASDYRTLFDGISHEIIRISDARSLAEGYNRGMERARGDALIFSHDDVCIISRDFALRCLEHLEHCDLFGVAGTTFLSGAGWALAGWPALAGQIGMDSARPGSIGVTAYAHVTMPLVHGIQALDGLLLVVKRSVALRHRFDDMTFDGWHMYDLDFSFRVAAAGHDVAVANDLLIIHNSKLGGYLTQAWRDYEKRFLQKFADQLTALGTTGGTEICTVVVDSADEWRLLAAARLVPVTSAAP